MTSTDSTACLRQLKIAASSFRLGMDGQANEALARFVDELETWARTPSFLTRTNDVLGLLPRIVAAQERGDTLQVADLLEHELAPRLAAEGSPAESNETDH